jgi:hypothetical protein
MRVRLRRLLILIIVTCCAFTHAAGKKQSNATTADTAKTATTAKTTATAKKTTKKSVADQMSTIENIDDQRIEEIIEEGEKHLLVFFCRSCVCVHGTRSADELRAKCGLCNKALDVLEEIDDDIEETGYIEVVKTDDKHAARSFGVHTFPALVYVRRSEPILYDGARACTHLPPSAIAKQATSTTPTLYYAGFAHMTLSRIGN